MLAAYDSSVKRVQADGGYGTVDVLRLAKGTPNTAPMRRSFSTNTCTPKTKCASSSRARARSICTCDGKVYQAICVRGDLISVPAGTPHWFDMGPDPEFTAIRWFNNQEGWVPQYSGTAIAARFPKYE